MDPKTLEALKGSIRKWEKIVDGTGIDAGPANCPLCDLFYEKECRDCPVAKRTGQTYCCGSPYDDYDIDGSKETAEAELKFLKSLLPE